MINHDELTGLNVHVVHAFEFVNALARTTSTGYTEQDIKKLALQLDNFSLWQLKSNAPIEWVHIADTSPNFNTKVNNNPQVTTAYSHATASGNAHGLTKADLSLDNVPNLDFSNAANITSGQLPSSVLPPIAISSTFVVSSEVAQLALVAQEGDVAIRSDLPASYIHNGGDAGTMADWTEFKSPTDIVLSVNGNTGAVVLSQDDVGDGSSYVRTENNFSGTLKTKLDNIESGANDYTHPTTVGNKHIPAGGQIGNVLGWDSDGTSTWEAPASTVTNSSLVRRTGAGDIHSRYFHTTAVEQANAPSHIFVSIDDDGYIRKQPLSDAKENLGINTKAPLNNPTFTGTVTAPTFNTISSRKLKENIQAFNMDACRLIESVDVVTYNYIADVKKNTKIGFIADDTDPLLATVNQDRMDMVNILGALMKSTQELITRLKKLEDKVDGLH